MVLTDPAEPDPDDPIRPDRRCGRAAHVHPRRQRVLASTTGVGPSLSGTVRPRRRRHRGGTRRGRSSQLAVSPDGNTVATGSMNSDVNSVARGSASALAVRWFKAGADRRRLSRRLSVIGLAFSPDGKRLVIGGVEQVRHLSARRRRDHHCRADERLDPSLAVSPDGTNARSRPVEWADPVLRSGDRQADRRRDCGNPDGATAIAFRDNSSVLVTVGTDGSFKLWDLVSLRSLSGRTLSTAESDAEGWRSSQSRVGTGSRDHRRRSWTAGS